MAGIQYLVDFKNCKCDDSLMYDAEKSVNALSKIITQSGMSIVNTSYHSFGEKCGYTACLILAESHVTISTWPEKGVANLDIFVCNHSSDNYLKAYKCNKLTSELFQAEHSEIRIIGRNDTLFTSWGYHTAIRLFDCNPELVRDENAIKDYVYRLCDLIDMKRYGECIVIDFGEDPSVSGFSMFQLIETSNISGHFVNQDNSIHLDIFSCKPYDYKTMIKFSEEFFESRESTFSYFER